MLFFFNFLYIILLVIVLTILTLTILMILLSGKNQQQDYNHFKKISTLEIGFI